MELLTIPLWILVYQLISISNNNIKRNIMSTIHSLVAIYLCLNDYHITIFYWSSSYYIYDLVMQLLSSSGLLSASTMTLALHHIIAIYTLEYFKLGENELTYIFTYMFMLLEISNIPVYIMYYWKQICKDKPDMNNFIKNFITKILLMCEILSFMLMRLTYSLYLLLINYHLFTMDLIFISLFLYLLSLFWWINMLYQIKKVN